MTKENYPRCLANTLREEGGWSNHPSDPGGPTMRGIIQREYTKYCAKHGLPDQSVRYISEAELQDIYRSNYWVPMVGDAWPKGPDQIVFDIAVNSGAGRAPRIMGAAMGVSTRNRGNSRPLRPAPPTRSGSSSAPALGARASIARSAPSLCSARDGSPATPGWRQSASAWRWKRKASVTSPANSSAKPRARRSAPSAADMGARLLENAE